VGERHDDRKDHGGCADYSSADKDRLSGGFESVTGAVVGFEQRFGALEVTLML